MLSTGCLWAGCRSCGVARSIIVGFHPADPGSNPGTSIYPRKNAVLRRSIFLAIDKVSLIKALNYRNAKRQFLDELMCILIH